MATSNGSNGAHDLASDIIQDEIIPYSKIPFMHWGIINKHNFSSLEKVPRKRWDPLGLSPITLDDFGRKIVLAKSYGHYSYISPVRPTRQAPVSSVTPLQMNRLTSMETIEVFKPIIEGRNVFSEVDPDIVIGDAHAIILCNGKEKIDPPFSVDPKVYKNLHGDAFTLINKFPAMVRCIDAELVEYIEKNMPLHAKMAKGVNLVTIPTQFYKRLEEMPVNTLAEVLQSMITGILLVKEEANTRGIKVMPTSPFFDIGKQVSGNLQRIHGQVYMDLAEDGHGSRMEALLKAFEKMKEEKHCELCTSTHDNGKRTVYENDTWKFFTAGSPLRNYHLRFCPKDHIENFCDLSPKQVADLAAGLKLIFSVLNELKVNPNRNLVFNTKPFGYTNAYFHVFGDILPHEFVGGAELLDDMCVVRINPADAAREMRIQIKERYNC